MTPHADFACNAKACRTAEGATVYDLPVNATRCPVCGSKRLVRLFSPPNISRGIARRSDALLEPDYTRMQQNHDKAKEAQKVTPMFAVPMARLAPTLQAYGVSPIAASAGIARPAAVTSDPVVGGLKSIGMTRVPTAVEKKWTPSTEDRGRAGG